jgi:hypothetical protein
VHDGDSNNRHTRVSCMRPGIKFKQDYKSVARGNNKVHTATSRPALWHNVQAEEKQVVKQHSTAQVEAACTG